MFAALGIGKMVGATCAHVFSSRWGVYSDPSRVFRDAFAANCDPSPHGVIHAVFFAIHHVFFAMRSVRIAIHRPHGVIRAVFFAIQHLFFAIDAVRAAFLTLFLKIRTLRLGVGEELLSTYLSVFKAVFGNIRFHSPTSSFNNLNPMRAGCARSKDSMKLIGIVIVIVGLALRWKTGPVVLAAALVTGLVAGMPFVGSLQTPGVLDTLGKAFVDNRLITLYLLTLPAVGLAEKAGLHAYAGDLIRRIRSASLGRLLWTYQLARVFIGAAGIRLTGHAVFGRPIVAPMATGLLEHPTEHSEDIAKAGVAASENYGNFFGQNLFPASAGCLLVAGVMKGAGYPVDIVTLAKLAIPIVVVSLVFSAIQFAWIGRKLRKEKQADVQ